MAEKDPDQELDLVDESASEKNDPVEIPPSGFVKKQVSAVSISSKLLKCEFRFVNIHVKHSVTRPFTKSLLKFNLDY